jgi:hypothetical protein
VRGPAAASELCRASGEDSPTLYIGTARVYTGWITGQISGPLVKQADHKEPNARPICSLPVGVCTFLFVPLLSPPIISFSPRKESMN